MALSKEHNGHCSHVASELSVNKTVAVFASPVSLCPCNEKLKLVIVLLCISDNQHMLLDLGHHCMINYHRQTYVYTLN